MAPQTTDPPILKRSFLREYSVEIFFGSLFVLGILGLLLA
jgi:hypothetical protein